jgi:prepilin-type N-terminal cleavage/methylation domain-containing protein
MKHQKQGFTLVEIMIVVMIIGLLAAIALPGFQKARESSQENACINNLRVIEGAKDQYAIEQNMTTGDTPTYSNIFGTGAFIDDTPECPGGGSYTFGAIGTDSTCSIAGHSL